MKPYGVRELVTALVWRVLSTQPELATLPPKSEYTIGRIDYTRTICLHQIRPTATRSGATRLPHTFPDKGVREETMQRG